MSDFSKAFLTGLALVYGIKLLVMILSGWTGGPL